MVVSPALLSVAVLIMLNVIACAYFFGRLGKRVDQSEADIAMLKKLCKSMQALVEQANRNGDHMGFRMDGLEKLEQKVDALRDAVIESRTAGETERAAMKRQSEKMEREVGGIHRQLANIASGKTELLQIKTLPER